MFTALTMSVTELIIILVSFALGLAVGWLARGTLEKTLKTISNFSRIFTK